MKGELLSIATPDPRAAQDAVRNASGVTSTMLMGDAVHVVVDNAQSRMPELKAALSAAGVEFEGIAAIPPTIEDLFVTLDVSTVDG